MDPLAIAPRIPERAEAVNAPSGTPKKTAAPEASLVLCVVVPPDVRATDTFGTGPVTASRTRTRTIPFGVRTTRYGSISVPDPVSGVPETKEAARCSPESSVARTPTEPGRDTRRLGNWYSLLD